MTRNGLLAVDKLNWNEGLWGPLPGVLEAVAVALPDTWAYPEHAYDELRDAIAAENTVPREQVVPGHRIHALVLTLINPFVGPGDTVLVPAPTLRLYPQASTLPRPRRQ